MELFVSLFKTGSQYLGIPFWGGLGMAFLQMICEAVYKCLYINALCLFRLLLVEKSLHRLSAQRLSGTTVQRLSAKVLSG